MKPEARKLIKLLKFDPNQPSSQAALKTYVAATVRASSYPNLLPEDVPALAVKAYLVTYDFSLKPTEDYLRRFARSLCQNFSVLQEKGHPKWREVELALPDLGRGWLYYPPAASELRACMAAQGQAEVAACTNLLAAGADPGPVQGRVTGTKSPCRPRERDLRSRPQDDGADDQSRVLRS